VLSLVNINLFEAFLFGNALDLRHFPTLDACPLSLTSPSQVHHTINIDNFAIKLGNVITYGPWNFVSFSLKSTFELYHEHCQFVRLELLVNASTPHNTYCNLSKINENVIFVGI